MNGDALGPAFDTATLIRPTQRKLVGCWMESAGCATLILPEVWRELTRNAGSGHRFRAADAWVRLAELPGTPFRWVEWSAELDAAVEDLLNHFTEACFPTKTAEQIAFSSDAIIVAQALVLGTDLLVTTDVNSMNHDEINHIVERRLGRNSGFVVTLDEALRVAFPAADAGDALLMMALSTIAPSHDGEWPVDDAHEALERLCEAAAGASLRTTAVKLMNRWNQCADLEALLRNARQTAQHSDALRFERMRMAWHRSHGGHDEPLQSHGVRR